MERLRIVEEGQERYFDLANRLVTIGRSSKNEISLKDRNTSRRHCNVLQVGDSWFAVDCDSHNGTFVNGVRISKKELVNGDRISIGEVNIFFLSGKENENKAQPVEQAAVADKAAGEKAAAPVDKAVVAAGKGKNGNKAADQEMLFKEDMLDEMEDMIPQRRDDSGKPEKPMAPAVPSKVDEIDKELMEASQKQEALRPAPAKSPVPDEPKIAPPVLPEKEPVKAKESDVAGKNGEQMAKDLNQLRDLYHRFQSQMAFHLIGQEKIGKLLITSLLAGGHCLLQGDNLAAKAIIASRAAKGLNLAFRHIYWNNAYAPETLRKSNVVLLQNVPLELVTSVLCESRLKLVSSGDRSYKLPEPYLMVMNDDGGGDNSLLKALHNFFVFAVPLSPLALQEEISLLEMSTQEVENEKSLVSPQEFQNFQRLVETIKISRSCLEYIGRLMRATRPEEEDAPSFVKEKVSKGVNPTVGVWIVKGAQATAALHGREAVSAKDIQGIARYLIPPRLALTPQAIKTGDSGEVIYHSILGKLKEPVE